MSQMGLRFSDIRLDRLLVIFVLIFVNTSAGRNRDEMQAMQDSGSVSAKTAPPVDAATDRAFLSVLQESLRNGDRKRLLSLIRFPISVNGQGTLLSEAFVRDYDKIWNSQTTASVLNQNPDDLYVDEDIGEAIGCGEVWFRNVGGQGFRIIAFNNSKYARAGLSMRECYQAKKLQTALADDNRKQVAEMLNYPISVRSASHSLTLRTREDTMRQYDFVFPLKIRRVVAEQRIPKLFPQSDGVSFGDGNIWISQPSQSGPFKVTSIFQ
jgi:hypothetical protein